MWHAIAATGFVFVYIGATTFIGITFSTHGDRIMQALGLSKGR